jgi:hypothetical protein
MSVAVKFDISRPRVTRGLLAASVDGRSWDGTLGDGNCIVDPITSTLLLRPYQLRDDWETTYSGSYARLSRASYVKSDLTTPLPASEWAENNRRGNGDIYLESRGVNYAVFTSATYAANRGFFLSFYVPEGSGLGKNAIECGWGTPGDPDTVSLRILGGGRVQVYKGAAMVGTGSISGAAQEVKRYSQIGPAGAEGTPNGDVVGRVVNLYLIPCRKRELLVLSATGDGFSHVFADLDPDTVNDITAPLSHFWWQVAQGKASVQCAPLTYPTAGWIASLPLFLRLPPPTGATFVVADFWDIPVSGSSAMSAPSLREIDGTTAYTPDGVIDTITIRCDLTGSGTETPFVYDVDYVLPPETADTNAVEMADIAGNVQRLSLNVPEDPGGVRLTVSAKDPASMPIAYPTRTGNRPMQAELDGVTFFTGNTGKPEYGAGKSASAETLNWEVRDLWSQLETARYEESRPAFDGFPLHEVFAELLQDAGIPMAEWDIETSAFNLPLSPAASKGEWAYRPEALDTVADWILRIARTFAPTWYIGFYPTLTGPMFRARSESTLSATPKATLYMDREEDGDKTAILGFREDCYPAETTRLSVVGYDPTTKTVLRDRRIYSILEDPTLLPSLRPAGWVGEITPVGVVEPRLVTAASVSHAADQLEERLTSELRVAQIKTRQLLRDGDGLILYRGDVIRVYPGAIASHEGGDYRIQSLQSSINKSAPDARSSPTTYTAKRIGDLP